MNFQPVMMCELLSGLRIYWQNARERCWFIAPAGALPLSLHHQRGRWDGYIQKQLHLAHGSSQQRARGIVALPEQMSSYLLIYFFILDGPSL